jgi:hypothetical protein
VAADPKEESTRIPIPKRRMGCGTVGGFLVWLVAIVVGVAILVLLGRLDLIDPQFS